MIVISKISGGLPEYFSLDSAYSIGTQFAWVTNPDVALGFARKIDAENFKKKSPHLPLDRTIVEDVK